MFRRDMSEGKPRAQAAGARLRPLIGLALGLFAAVALSGCGRVADVLHHLFGGGPAVSGQYA